MEEGEKAFLIKHLLALSPHGGTKDAGVAAVFYARAKRNPSALVLHPFVKPRAPLLIILFPFLGRRGTDTPPSSNLLRERGEGEPLRNRPIKSSSSSLLCSL